MTPPVAAESFVLIPLEPSNRERVDRVLAFLRGDPRWHRGESVLRRMLGDPVPSLDAFLTQARPIGDADDDEREAWLLYAETLVPMVRLGILEGEGNWGNAAQNEPPIDHPFVRVRARP